MSRGFSLIEMLVSLAVMLLIFGIVYPRYRVVARRSSLLSASYEASQRLREAQDLALSSEKVNGKTPDGYGVYFDMATPGLYRLYADLNNNAQFDGGETDRVVGDPIELEDTLFVSSLESGGSRQSVSVNFSPPAPATTITSGAGADLSSIIVKLSAEDTDLIKSIIVNKAGLIYVE